MNKEVRTRFAPSPTGYLHVGGARTALFNWLWARKNGGEFLLRIEDTDQARLVEDAEDQIKRSLDWLGLGHDGEAIHQSVRLETYQKYAQRLLSEGKAYVADETPEELTADREAQKARGEQPYYRSTSRDKNLAYDPSKNHVIRFKWPDAPGQVTFTDELRGQIKAEGDTALEDFVLLKADGFPTYNFANVVDDHEMAISHVIRGEEFIASTHRHTALYQALEWDPPAFVHVPSILGPDKAKLSKRHGAKNVLDYRRDGYLSEALANFVALIGWNPGGNRELFWSLDELAEAFTLDGLQKSPGLFDKTKLRWMNKEHMKNRDAGELQVLAVAEGFWSQQSNNDLFTLSLERAETMADLKVEDFYTCRPKLTIKQLAGEKNPETIATWLERTQRYLETVTDWQPERLQGALTDIRNELNVTPKQLYPVLREAVTGAAQTPALWDVFAVLGRDETLARLEAAASLVA